MLLAVNIGRSLPSRLNLSSRRSIRRLRLFNRRRMLTFTRNPFLAEVGEQRLTIQTPQKARGVSSFFDFSPVRREVSTLVQGLASLDRHDGGSPDQGERPCANYSQRLSASL